MKKLEREIIHWGKMLFERRLISGWGGNISCRLGSNRFLITGQHAPLGFLTLKDLVEIDARGKPLKKKRQASSETPLHLAVYKGTDAKAVIHVHPPMVLAFSLSHRSFVPLSFEEKYTLGEVPVIPQETPTVTQPEKVVEELKFRPVVILQGHGTVAAGKDLQEAFLLTDMLEESVHCQFFKNDKTPAVAGTSHSTRDAQEENPAPKGKAYVLFSSEHVDALVRCANEDAEFRSQASELGVTTTMSLHLENNDSRWTISFAEGEVAGFEPGGEGEFVISGKREWWAAIFQGRIDPFLATQQGKLRLIRGELWKLSGWFKPFQRAFTLWQTIPIR